MNIIYICKCSNYRYMYLKMFSLFVLVVSLNTLFLSPASKLKMPELFTKSLSALIVVPLWKTAQVTLTAPSSPRLRTTLQVTTSFSWVEWVGVQSPRKLNTPFALSLFKTKMNYWYVEIWLNNIIEKQRFNLKCSSPKHT